MKALRIQDKLLTKDILHTVNGSEAEDLARKLDDMQYKLDSLVYKSGEVWGFSETNQGVCCPGMLTGGNTLIIFTITTPKSMQDVSRLTVMELKANIRGVNGYLGASEYVGAGYDYLRSSGYTVTTTMIGDKHIRLTIEKNSGLGGQNNTPVTVALEKFTIRFD